ncbi:VOC family protein [Aduncisulcus paluster]|uniref:VOC family protein n=1 Tax=Aduncisulcus paluster TaxID=2918883 RepID=A0ABQ5K7M9_9EUKA|nr:VOC family protein [Aduncisulcus paluster]
MAEKMTKAQFTHIALQVSDSTKMAEFLSKYCNLTVTSKRPGMGGQVYWVASCEEKGVVFVILPRGEDRIPDWRKDLTHIGFAVESKEMVDKIAEMAKEDHILEFGPKMLPPPTNYIALVRSPGGQIFEFSYGQDYDVDPVEQASTIEKK